MVKSEKAVIVGAGAGLSAALARLFAAEGMAVALAARNPDKLAALTSETGARAYGCDVTQPDAVAGLFAALDRDLGVPDIVVYNPSRRLAGPVESLDPEAVRDALMVTAFGGFLVAQAAARRMQARGSGSLLFTGASASVKGFARSAPFAMGKFGLRGLVQSLAREMAPQGIHVAHFIIDGGIRPPGGDGVRDGSPDAMLVPDEIARTYLAVHRQHRSAWTWEVELRPWVERF